MLSIPEPMKSIHASLPHPVLVVSATSKVTQALIAECEASAELWVLRVDNVSAAIQILRTSHVSVVVTGPELRVPQVSRLLAALADCQPKVPALVVRAHASTRPEAWRSHTVAVLDFPLSPGLLPRAVTAALGLRGMRIPTN